MEKFKHNKTLGQNFLKSEKALDQIIEAGSLKNGEWVLEIGPGLGVLTQKLLEKGSKVVSIEKDKKLIEILQEKFKSYIESKQFYLLNEDVLYFDVEQSPIEKNDYKIIANIPYYITGEILRLSLSKWRQPTKLILMIQKEVAQRICTKDSKESLLSISVKIYGEPSIVDYVKAGSFVPAPKVDSAIIKIEQISKERLNDVKEDLFFKLVKTGFSHKRKMLLGNLKNVFEKNIEEILIKNKINPKERAENLKVEDWIKIAKNL